MHLISSRLPSSPLFSAPRLSHGPLLSSPLLISLHITVQHLLFTLSPSPITSLPDDSDVDGKSLEKRAVARVKTVTPDMYHQQIGYCNKSETCVLYPKVPKAWLANGFIIIPSLSEKGGSWKRPLLVQQPSIPFYHFHCSPFYLSICSPPSPLLHLSNTSSHLLSPPFPSPSPGPRCLPIGVKGHFEMEVFSSEPVKLNQLSESNSRIIAGEWTETTAGGSHLNTLSFKKNPRFTLKLRKAGQGRRSSMDSRSDRSPYNPPPVDLNPQEPVKTRITVTRVGLNWKAAMKKDTVGCMVGFYLFIRRNLSLPALSSSAPPAPNAAPSQSYELVQIYESTFAPDYEASTEEDFVLGERLAVLCCDLM